MTPSSISLITDLPVTVRLPARVSQKSIKWWAAARGNLEQGHPGVPVVCRLERYRRAGRRDHGADVFATLRCQGQGRLRNGFPVEALCVTGQSVEGEGFNIPHRQVPETTGEGGRGQGDFQSV